MVDRGWGIWYFISSIDMSIRDMLMLDMFLALQALRLGQKGSCLGLALIQAETELELGGMSLNEALRKKYIPMTETTYYTLLAVTEPRHGYAIMQYVAALTQDRLLLGTGTLYTMVGRLTADGIIEVRQEDGKKSYLLTQSGMELLGEETKRLGQQLTDGLKVLSGGAQTVE